MRSLQIGIFLIPIQQIVPTASKYLYLENIWCFSGTDRLCVLCSKDLWFMKGLGGEQVMHPEGALLCHGAGAQRQGGTATFPLSPWCPLTVWVMPSPTIPYDSLKEMLPEAQLSHPSQLQNHDLGCWVRDVLRHRFATANAPLETADYSSATN